MIAWACQVFRPGGVRSRCVRPKTATDTRQLALTQSRGYRAHPGCPVVLGASSVSRRSMRFRDSSCLLTAYCSAKWRISAVTSQVVTCLEPASDTPVASSIRLAATPWSRDHFGRASVKRRRLPRSEVPSIDRSGSPPARPSGRVSMRTETGWTFRSPIAERAAEYSQCARSVGVNLAILPPRSATRRPFTRRGLPLWASSCRFPDAGEGASWLGARRLRSTSATTTRCVSTPLAIVGSSP